MTTTLQQRILDDLEGKIHAGQWPVGSRLPSEKEFEIIYGASRAPVRHALQQLAQRGLIERRPGRGTFVKSNSYKPIHTELSPFSFYYSKYLDRISVETISVSTESPPDEVRDALGLGGKADTTAIQRVKRMDGRPVIAFRSWFGRGLPEAPFREHTEFFRTVDLLREVFGIRCAHAEEVADAVLPEPPVRELLELAEKAPVLRVKHIVYDWEGSPVVFILYYVNTEMWKYRVALTV